MILLFSCSGTDDSSEFKVMAWNIWHGGQGESLPDDGRSDVAERIIYLSQRSWICSHYVQSKIINAADHFLI